MSLSDGAAWEKEFPPRANEASERKRLTKAAIEHIRKRDKDKWDYLAEKDEPEPAKHDVESHVAFAAEQIAQARRETWEEADKISERIGMKLLEKGDKAGWSVCDDVGHALRARAQEDSQ